MIILQVIEKIFLSQCVLSDHVFFFFFSAFPVLCATCVYISAFPAPPYKPVPLETPFH